MLFQVPVMCLPFPDGCFDLIFHPVSIADGVIQECGTHQELLEKGGIYSELYRTQNALALEALQ